MKIIYAILSLLFFVLGGIGLVLPIIPQIPFLILGFVFLSASSKKVRVRLKNSELYKKHIEIFVNKNRVLQHLLEEC